jgi:hypothetical protein
MVYVQRFECCNMPVTLSDVALGQLVKVACVRTTLQVKADVSQHETTSGLRMPAAAISCVFYVVSRAAPSGRQQQAFQLAGCRPGATALCELEFYGHCSPP